MARWNLHLLGAAALLAGLAIGAEPIDSETPADPVAPTNAVAEPTADAAVAPEPPDSSAVTSPTAVPAEPAEAETEVAAAVSDPKPAPAPAVAADAPRVIETPAVPAVTPAELDALALRLDMIELAMSAQKNAVEQALARQQEQAYGVVLQSNRTVLVVAGLLGGLGLLGILTASILLVRALNRISDMAVALPMAQQFGRGGVAGSMLGEAFGGAIPAQIEHVSARFLGAIEQLEKRIHDLEIPGTPSAVPSPPGNGEMGEEGNVAASSSSGPSIPATGNPDTASPNSGPQDERLAAVRELLAKGETLLGADSGEEALECMEQALLLAPRHTEALIKRGMALEKLQRLDAALASYDQAIAADTRSTLAYLHKGAVCNRLQRYREALDCYERALAAEHQT